MILLAMRALRAFIVLNSWRSCKCPVSTHIRSYKAVFNSFISGNLPIVVLLQFLK